MSQPEPFDRQAILTGERVLLRPYRDEDFAALFAVASDPLIWEVHPAHDRWQEPVFRAFMADAVELGGTLVAIDRQTGEIVGSTRFQKLDRERSQVEIGWTFLARSHWGGGFNHEMKRLMLAHAFTGVDRVVLHIGEDNIRSRKACENIGGRLTGEEDEVERGGRMVRHVIYAITRDDFERGPLAS
jgi:RimJ/RimL family protein N-acetyltransferase